MLPGDLAAAVRARKQAQDVVVMGSASVVHALMAEDLVDEYRLIVFPEVLGEGERVFPGGTGPVTLALVSAEATGPTVRLVYTRPAGSAAATDVTARREDRNAGRSSRPSCGITRHVISFRCIDSIYSLARELR